MTDVKRIKWFKEISKDDIADVGGKGANLGEMYNAGLPVPAGFFVSAQTYKEFIEKTGIINDINQILKGLDVNDTKELQRRVNQIQQIISKTLIPDEIKEDIIDAYEALNTDDLLSHKDVFVAVRSSATAEDLPGASFAGQQATFLNVKGKDDLVKSVQMCWASLFTARATYYRVKNNFDHMKVLISVVVQKMVNSNQAGIMFSANPATNKGDEIVIEAVHGLGETAVGGNVTPDNYILDKNDLTIKSKELHKQEWGLFRDENGKTEKVDIPEEADVQQVINDDIIFQLAELAKKIEKHYGQPQDMEWAVEKGKVFIVQSRPITTLNEDKTNDEIEGTAIVKGQTACKGAASGTVKIIHDASELDKIQKGDVLVTEMTNPDMVIAMQRAVAILTDEGGITSHAAIVSREMQIPCIVGTGNATKVLKDGQVITVDATHGHVLDGKQEFEVQETVIEEKVDTKIKIKCIVDIPEVAEMAAETNADGIGLYRLELTVAEGGIHPKEFIRNNEDDTYTDFIVDKLKTVGDAFKDKPIWIRTTDLRTDEYRGLEGGDREPKEDNPMLGWHGVRRSLDDSRILKAEFKAIKKLHELGYKNFGIMVPFVIRVEELKQAKDLMREVGLEPVQDVDFGVMIETPASCWIIEELCQEGISFVSFGTNDLTQLTLGIDRNNEAIQPLFDEMHPAIFGQIKKVVEVCKKHNVETSICGQAGSRPEMAKFLVSIGINSLSVNRDSVHDISELVSGIENDRN